MPLLDCGAEACPEPAPSLLNRSHFGVCMSYLCSGLVSGFADAVVYPVLVLLHGEPNNFQQAVQAAFSVWWNLKVLFGLLTDGVPLFGLRRKPYMILGWLIALSASTALALTAQLAGKTSICQDDARERVPCDAPHAFGPFEISDMPIGHLVGWMIVNNFGIVMADVAADSLVIEYARRERTEDRGSTQAVCYAIRALGSVVSCSVTGFGLNGPEYGGSFSFAIPLPWLLWILVGLQAIGLPWWLLLREERVEACTPGVAHCVVQVMDLMQNKTFSKLMVFTMILNLSQAVVVNARNTVLATWVEMTPLVNALDRVLQGFIMMLTMAAAAKWLKHYNWRSLLVLGTTFYVSTSFLFFLVVFGVIREPWFVIFIDSDKTLGQNVSYLVVFWAIVEIVPQGVEGTTQAFTTTVCLAGGALGGYFVMGYNALFALSRQDIAGDSLHTRYQYMYNSLLCMVTQCAFVLFLEWMPSQREDARLKFLKAGSSNVWRAATLSALVLALAWGIGSSLAALACPCARLLGGDGCADGCMHG